MDDRIKLAEAMDTVSYVPSCPEAPFIVQWRPNDGTFDPFTDANDDYAVLEWMRSTRTKKPFTCEHEATDYKIGDYARDALKVLDGQT